MSKAMSAEFPHGNKTSWSSCSLEMNDETGKSEKWIFVIRHKKIFAWDENISCLLSVRTVQRTKQKTTS